MIGAVISVPAVCYCCYRCLFGSGVWLLSFGWFWLVLSLSFDGFNWFSPYMYGGISPLRRSHSTRALAQHGMHNTAHEDMIMSWHMGSTNHMQRGRIGGRGNGRRRRRRQRAGTAAANDLAALRGRLERGAVQLGIVQLGIVQLGIALDELTMPSRTKSTMMEESVTANRNARDRGSKSTRN